MVLKFGICIELKLSSLFLDQWTEQFFIWARNIWSPDNKYMLGTLMSYLFSMIGHR